MDAVMHGIRKNNEALHTVDIISFSCVMGKLLPLLYKFTEFTSTYSYT